MTGASVTPTALVGPEGLETHSRLHASHDIASATPGPWTASVEARPFATGGHWYVVTDGEENGIGEFYGDDHEANVANLRLAAAAPELYDALLALLPSRLCGENWNIPDNELVPIDITFGELRAARAALAKALGEQVQP